MRRALIAISLLTAAIGLLAPPAPAPAQQPGDAVRPLKLASRDRDTVLRDGLVFSQRVLQPGFTSWEARLAPTPRAGQIAAHRLPLVTSIMTREIAAPSTHRVDLPLSAEGVRLVKGRRLVRLVIRTTVDDGFGHRVVATRSVTLTG